MSLTHCQLCPGAEFSGNAFTNGDILLFFRKPKEIIQGKTLLLLNKFLFIYFYVKHVLYGKYSMH